VSDTPEQRLARWAERDVVVGLDAELHEARAIIGERDAEVAALKARNTQLANQVAQLSVERDAQRRRQVSSTQPSFARRVYRRLRSIVGRLVPG